MEFVLFSKIKKIILYAFIVYAFLDFILLPLLLKPQIIKAIDSEVSTTLSVENLSFDTLMLNIGPSSPLYGALLVQKAFLDTRSIHLIYNKDNTINLLNILKPTKETSKDSNSSLSLPRVIVDNVKIHNGALFYNNFSV